MVPHTIDAIITQVGKYAPDFDPARLQQAYELAAEAHEHQKRKTGEPYVIHCLETAATLAELRLDPPVVVAGLLHDTVEDTTVTLADIREEFGEEVAKLVDGVTKLSQIADMTGHRKRDLDHREAESLRKMFLAMGDDVRVVLIKLADRLHNMRTLHALRREKQKRIARETLDIFAPLANRLGIWQIKWELEDLCVPATWSRMIYKEIAGAALNERRDEREQLHRTRHQPCCAQTLEAIGIHGRHHRPPEAHLQHLQEDASARSATLDQILRRARRARLVKNLARLLRGAGRRAQPVAADPRPSSMTTSPSPRKTVTNRCTRRWWHRKGKTARGADPHAGDAPALRSTALRRTGATRSRSSATATDEKMRLLRQMLEWREDEDIDAEDFSTQVREDVLPDRVYVVTPKGEVIDLPAGATPIDFAYHIHTDVGSRCRGAKVNGNIVPLNYQLKNGDQVEIIIAKRAAPSRDWLNPFLGYVNTSRARSKVRAWFRKQDRGENIVQGRELMERELRKLGLNDSLEKVAQQSKYDRLDDFLAAVGCGDISPHTIAVKLLEAQRAQNTATGIEAEVAAFQSKRPPEQPKLTQRAVSVSGVSDLMTHMAGCCKPVPGDDITGYITRGNGITVHRQTCPNVLNNKDRDRVIDLNWGNDRSGDVFLAPIRVLALDREGLLRDIVDVVGNESVNMRSVNAVTSREEGSAVVTAVLEVTDASQLSRILSRINRLPNVFEAHRATG